MRQWGFIILVIEEGMRKDELDFSDSYRDYFRWSDPRGNSSIFRRFCGNNEIYWIVDNFIRTSGWVLYFYSKMIA